MKKLKYNSKKNKGITIIALVVTIIILIILAGVSINLTLGDNGLITMAKMAKENMQLAQTEEQDKLNELYKQIEKEGEFEGDITVGELQQTIDDLKGTVDNLTNQLEDEQAQKKELEQKIEELKSQLQQEQTEKEELEKQMKDESIRLDNNSISVLHNSRWYTQVQCSSSYTVTKADETKYSHLMLLYTSSAYVNFPDCGGKTLLVGNQNFFNTGNGSIYLIKKPTEGSTFSYTSTSGSEWYKGFIVFGIPY